MSDFDRRKFLQGAFIACSGSTLSSRANAILGYVNFTARNKLNVLIITVDDMDWESTGLFIRKTVILRPTLTGLVSTAWRLSILMC